MATTPRARTTRSKSKSAGGEPPPEAALDAPQPAISPDPRVVERSVVEVAEPVLGFAEDTPADAVEIQEVYRAACYLRAANAAWGIDAGMSKDVMEARAMLAEVRRQVRERVPIENPYPESGDAEKEQGPGAERAEV